MSINNTNLGSRILNCQIPVFPEGWLIFNVFAEYTFNFRGNRLCICSSHGNTELVTAKVGRPRSTNKPKMRYFFIFILLYSSLFLCALRFLRQMSRLIIKTIRTPRIIAIVCREICSIIGGLAFSTMF